jgi:hypothetical protein
LISIWAPPSENNTDNYIKETARRVGITNVDTPLADYLDVMRVL